MEVQILAKYKTENYIFLLNAIANKISLIPLEKEIGGKVLDTIYFSSSTPRTVIEKKVKEISGCDEFELWLFNQRTGLFENYDKEEE